MARRICFVGGDNYPVLDPAYGGAYIGGESVQQTLLARAFVRAGYEVSMVVNDLGQDDGVLVDGIRVWKTFRPGAGLPVVRFIYPRMTSILSALKNADANIYYQSCAGMMTGLVAWFCRRHDRTFLFRVAHDSDCIPGRQLIRYWRDRKLYEYGLRHAELIAVQTQRQAGLLRDNYQLDGIPVNMAVEEPGRSARPERDIDVLWVNNMRPFKRPEMVFDLAARLPDHQHVMIGGPVGGHEAYYESLQSRAKKFPNLNFTGPVPYQQVNDYFERARVFINTSETEGFPNSFLQAWIRGVPVISFFDPDGLIAREQLGAVPDELEGMATAVKGLLKDTHALRRLSESVSRYARKHYVPDGIAMRYIELIEPSAGSRGGHG